MNKFFLVFTIAIATLTAAYSQPHIVAMFTPHNHTFNGTTIPYRLFIPQNYDSTQVYPLVLALHGSGERGSDNLIQILSHRLATSWADPLNQVNYPCFVVAPQCPLTRSWTYSWTGLIGPELATVVDIIDSLQTVFSVDSSRLYVTGLSMGGFGTWDLIQRFPDKFAAAIPMSAGGDSSQTSAISEVPIWNFHGKIDDTVPVELSRDMIMALENKGKRMIYTHCKYENCTGLPDSTIDMYVNSHSSHFYTEYVNGGHVIWAESYDYPYLFPWVFSKYRMIPNSIQLTNLNNYRTLSLIENITWNAINQDGSVELRYSPDYGDTWQLLEDSATNNGTYAWNTELVDDCALGLLKLFLKNNDGFIYGLSESAPFAINNSMNGVPFVKILNDEFDKGVTIDEDTLQLKLLIADPEQSNLITTIYYSADDGLNFEIAASFMVNSDTAVQQINLYVNNLANSYTAILRVEVSDGQSSSEDATFRFVKQSARPLSFPATQVSGSSDGMVTVQIIDPLQLTGDLYRLSFDDSSFSYKVYNVFNVNSGHYVVQNATALDGIAEGPYFEGMRLLVRDYDPPEVNFQQTGWQNSSTNLQLSVYLPEINIGPTILYGVPYPADYQITIYDFIADTSSTAFGAPAVPMKFTIQNLTENRPTELIFLDNDNNNLISHSDELYLLESDSLGDPYLIWAIHGGGNPPITLPVAGDQFLLETFKPFLALDLFEFTGSVNPVISINSSPEIFTLFNNYPNPFNPTTTISWQLTRPGPVKLEIYNLRGQKVTTLLSASLLSGFHSVEFDASGLASGVYFYRLEAGPYIETRKMVVLK